VKANNLDVLGTRLGNFEQALIVVYGGFNLGYFDIFNMLLPFSGILKVAAHNFMKSRSGDSLAAKDLFDEHFPK